MTQVDFSRKRNLRSQVALNCMLCPTGHKALIVAPLRQA
jgi:hypothetical protein